jgi:hypothetical protein
MRDLILRPGPHLVWSWDCPPADDGSPRTDETEVTTRAQEFLFDSVTLDSGVTLADVFGLLEASPVLKLVFATWSIEELCVEARKGPKRRPACPPEETVEALELIPQWRRDARTRTYEQTDRLLMHGIGPVLPDGRPEDYVPPGGRKGWDVSLSPLRELLELPVRVNHTLDIVVQNRRSKGGVTVEHGRLATVTLGQMLDGLLWELSFFGGPAGQARHQRRRMRKRKGSAD